MYFVTGYVGGPHGTAKSARDFARALLAVSSDVNIVSPHKDDFESVSAGFELTAPVWHIYAGINGKSKIWQKPFIDLRDGVRRLKIKRAMKGGFVIVNGWASYRYWQQLKITGIEKSVIIIRESPRHFAGSDRTNILEHMRSEFSRFDSLIFVSQRQKDEWCRFDELAKKPAFCLPNCCEEEEVALVKQTDRRSSLRDSLGVSHDETMIICPGTIEKRKGQDIVVDSLPEIVAAVPGVRVVFLGNAVTEWGSKLVEKIGEGPFSERIIHVPAQPSALEYLHAADILLFPSRAEAMPRTVLEAMAMGMPIVATSVDGIPELIENGVSGCLFDPEDPVGMVEGVKKIVERPDKARSMALMAEQRYKEMFSRRRQIERMSAILSRLL